MVVMGHVMLFMFPGGGSTPLFRIIAATHMPLFFFISGWFAYKPGSDGRPATISITDKAVRLLPPALVVSFLFCYYGTWIPGVPTNYIDLLLSSAKGGYWFPFTLFMCFALYACISRFLSHKLLRNIIVGVIAWVLASAVGKLMYAPLADLLELPESLPNHFPAFFFGILARMNEIRFRRLIEDSRVTSLAVLLLVLCGTCFANNAVFGKAMSRSLYIVVYQPYVLSLVVLAFRATDSCAERPSRAAALWSYLGRRSFAIYLLHYFLLFPVEGIGLAPISQLSFVPVVLIAAVVAAAIIGVTLVFDAVLSKAAPLAYLLCGDPLPRTNRK